MQFNQAPAPRESSLGDAYDPTASYSVDDLCIHDNVLYKCIVPISGGEAWNSEHWTETNISDEIKAVNNNSPQIISNENGIAYKFPNGLMICTKTVTKQVTYSTWGGIYESDLILFGDWPVAFIDIPVVFVALNNSGSGAISVAGAAQITQTSAGQGRATRPNNADYAFVTVGVTGIGRWK